MLKKWNVAKLNRERAIGISEQYGLPPLIAMLLDMRGISSEDDIYDFLYEDSIISDTSDFKDMDKAACRIRTAIDRDEKICIYGDFDADGVTSTALLYSYLRDTGANVEFYIPSRHDEGYGMNKSAVEKISGDGVKLIITVDNGISAVEEIEYANSMGIDVIVTDHHTPPEIIPDAYAVVDPWQKDCQSRFKQLCGVGVVLMLIIHLERDFAPADFILSSYSDIAAIGTIGDIVPLVKDNRIIVKHGLSHINKREREGINALLDESGFEDKTIASGNVSFTLVPRINAGGRLSTTEKCVEMLLSEDYDYAREIAAELSQFNTERQQMEKDILQEIDEMIKREPSIVQNRIIVIYGHGWHHGVIGIVASRIKETYGRPSIIISNDDGVCRGSGRSVEGFALCDILFACSDLLIQCGGHPMAVGFGIEEKNVEAFIRAINTHALADTIPAPSLSVDCKLNPSQLSLELVHSLKMLEPYGAGNRKPLFGLYNMQVVEIKELSNGKHLRFTLARGNTRINALKFNMTLCQCPFEIGDTADFAVSLEENEYNGKIQISVFIKDFKFSEMDIDSEVYSKSVFEAFCRGDNISAEDAQSLIPDRNDCAMVYRFLRLNSGYTKDAETLLFKSKCNISYGKLRVILEIMNETGLIEIYEGMHDTRIVLCEVNHKVDLMNCEIIKKLKEVV